MALSIIDIEKFFLNKDFARSISECELYLKQHNKDLKVLEIYALSLYNLNITEKALDTFKEIISIDPKHPTSDLNIARILKEKKVTDQSKLYYEKSILNYPLKEEVYNEYGNYLFQLNEFDNAEKHLFLAYKENSKYLPTYFNLSHFYLLRGDFKSSNIFINKLLKFNIKNNDILFKISDILFQLREYQRVEEILLYLNKESTLNVNYLNSLIYLYIIKGDKDSAKKYLSIAKSKFSNDPRILYLSSILNDFYCPVETLDNLSNTLERSKDIDSMCKINYVMFKFHDSKKDFNSASIYLKKFNKFKRSSFKNYSVDGHIEQFNKIADFFNDNYSGLKTIPVDSEISPIFIVGMPRSGSTLIEQVISSHPAVYGSGEIPFFTNSISRVFQKDDNINDYLNELKNLDQNKINKISKGYMHQVSFFNKKQKIRFTDKMLLNFKILPLLKICFPNAKILNVHREKKDNCFAILKNNFDNNFLPWAYDEVELVNFYKMYENVMSIYQKLMGNEILSIKYESFLDNTKQETSKILNFCELDDNNKCYEFFKNKREVLTSSVLQVRENIYKSSVNYYLNYNQYFKNFFDQLV